MDNTNNNLLFALDIGTRSVIGLVGEPCEGSGAVKLIAVHRREHHTRAMLDGQIHDVTEVANVLAAVKKELEIICGPLKKVAVAAAGRALCTMKASADLDVSGYGALDINHERALELAAIQNAQRQLAQSASDMEPTGYYCVGYSIIRYMLDNTLLKSLIGQRGRSAVIEIIATFLPRQVIDSLQSAIQSVDLEMATLTLEPIAAIHVLIPVTMRHLNLVLVDVGAGTSDIAITRKGSVIAYGMAPFAGDEITEAISEIYLMDFNIAEMVKRQLDEATKEVSFTDVLGMSRKVPVAEILTAIAPRVGELAQAIASQIIALNQGAPQAVLLVGGGSMTPMLPEALAQALDMPGDRVAIRRPDTVQDIIDIPPELCTPDAVTPLGILKLAGSRTLNFVNVTLNDLPLSLFSLGHLRISDALLAANLDVRSLRGRPGLGLTITVNGQTQFIKGTPGTTGSIRLNGAETTFEDIIQEGDVLIVNKGVDGVMPQPVLRDLVRIPDAVSMVVNDQACVIDPLITINDQAGFPAAVLQDRDQVVCRLPDTLEEVLTVLALDVAPITYRYVVNGTERNYQVYPSYSITRANQQLSARLSTPVRPKDRITIHQPPVPTFGELLGLQIPAMGGCIYVVYEGKSRSVPTIRHTVSADGKPVRPEDRAEPGCSIVFSTFEQSAPLLHDVLLAVQFDPHTIAPGSRVKILINGSPAEYTAPVKNGDAVDVILE